MVNSVNPCSESHKSVSDTDISNFLGDISDHNFMSVHWWQIQSFESSRKLKKWFRFWSKTNPKSKFSRKWAKLLLATKNSFEKSLGLHKGPNEYHIFSPDFTLSESNRFKRRSFERNDSSGIYSDKSLQHNACFRQLRTIKIRLFTSANKL